MKVFTLICAGFITGSLAGLVVDSPLWLRLPVIFLCAAGAIWLYRFLAEPLKLSIIRGGVGGLFSGILGGVFGTITYIFSGKILPLLAAGTLAFDKMYSFMGETLLQNLAWYAIPAVLGGAAGSLSIKMSIGLRAPATSGGRGPTKRLIGLRVLLSALVLAAGIVVGAVIPAMPALATMFSITKVDDFPFYTINYKNNYRFDDFLKTGIKTDALKLSRLRGDQLPACTCFAALNESGHPRFGRNFDWHPGVALFVFTSPPDGYASVSMVYLDTLGTKDYKNLSFPMRIFLYYAPYMPLDGMNECGLAIGENGVYAEDGKDPRKLNLSSSEVMRLVLDHAKNVNEAVALFRKYNIYFGDHPCHYLLADASGDSVVIEFVDGDMRVMHNTEPWQVATNFLLWRSTAEERAGDWRYALASKKLAESDGLLSQQGTMALLRDVHQGSTIWSNAYDMKSGDIQVAMGKNYDRLFNFKLTMKQVVPTASGTGGR